MQYYDITPEPMRIEAAFVQYLSYVLEHREAFHFMWEECDALGLCLRSGLFENRCFIVEEVGSHVLREAYGDLSGTQFTVWRFAADFHDVERLSLGEFTHYDDARRAALSVG